MPAHYGPEWAKTRRKYLGYHPKCERCGAIATDVDHIKPVAKFPHLILDWSNLRALCHSCHSKRTNNDQVHADKCSPAGLDGYPTDPDHPWNAQK